ncbi:MAG: cell wall-binding repeat-containing protein, partial [Euzebyales bacterium]|nr:cell wall-binding repeat-containing protein [Euzebyales bacterium]
MQRFIVVALAVLALLLTPLPAVGQAEHPEVERVSGADRYATAAAVAHLAFPDGAQTAFVATGEDFPDALASGPAAVAGDAPVLLAGRGFLPQPTREALAELGVQRVIVLGG